MDYIQLKTEKTMVRELFGTTVRQKHKSELMNANDLNVIGNKLREKEGLPQKQLAQYFSLPDTKKLMQELCLIDNVEENQIKKSTKGRDGGTWISPELFVDMAMWYSPKLKARILKWVVDGLLASRDNSGESYKKMMETLKLKFPDEFDDIRTYMRISNQIAAACKVGLNKDKWESANKDQLDSRDEIQNTISTIAEFCSNTSDCTSRAIRKVIKGNE